MPRPPRPDLAKVPQHVIQRGNDRKACFFHDDDCLTYLTLLRKAALRHDCAVHAYVLMTNHVDLLVTPAEYRWSSHRRNAYGEPDPLVRAHGEYLALGSASSPACVAYRTLLAQDSSAERLLEIRAYVQQQKALGGARFQSQIEAALGRHVQIRPAHRPRRERGIAENGL